MKLPAIVCFLVLVAASAHAQPRPATPPSPGESLFQSTCGFCHGRDATGGAAGPDLTDSELVAQDRGGNKIAAVIRNGRPERGMPAFPLQARDVKLLVDYLHRRKAEIDKNPGRRRKVSVADLSTGSVEAGRQYFNERGGCAACHSATGDLAGVGARYRGLALLQRFLYPTPTNAVVPPGEKPKPSPIVVTVTPPSGEPVSGPLVFRDEFTIALRDADGWFRSWPQSAVKVSIKDPLQTHAEQLAKYTDDDIHNLFAYLQTLVK